MTIDLTAGGKLSVNARVTEASYKKMTEMVAAGRLGGVGGTRARLDLAETLSTSDAPFSFAHLVNLRNLPLYEQETPSFDPIVSDEIVPDFAPATFYTLTPNFAGLEYGKDNDGQRIAPRVAELDTYQYAFGYTQEDATIAVEKRGFKVGWSLERAVNDTFNLLSRFPQDMLRVGQKTDEYVVIRALTSGVTSASKLQAGTDFITGDAVVADNALTPQALRVAIRQIGDRTVTGSDGQPVRVPIPARFRLVVGLGRSDSINWALGVARGLFSIDDGAIQYRPGNATLAGDPLNRISGIIESEFIGADAWYLVPEDGTTVRPALIRVSLAGYTSPEVYVSNFNGAPLAGGASSNPFTAFSFDNDSIDLKFRQFTNAAIFSEDQIVWSDGTP